MPDLIDILYSNDKIDVNNQCEYITKKYNKKQKEPNIEKFKIIITPLVKAIQLNNIEVVNYLLAKNNINIVSYPHDFGKDGRNENEK